MKYVGQVLLILAIICVALISLRYAVQLYRSKYTPRYLKGDAC